MDVTKITVNCLEKRLDHIPFYILYIRQCQCLSKNPAAPGLEYCPKLLPHEKIRTNRRNESQNRYDKNKQKINPLLIRPDLTQYN